MVIAGKKRLSLVSRADGLRLTLRCQAKHETI